MDVTQPALPPSVWFPSVHGRWVRRFALFAGQSPPEMGAFPPEMVGAWELLCWLEVVCANLCAL